MEEKFYICIKLEDDIIKLFNVSSMIKNVNFWNEIFRQLSIFWTNIVPKILLFEN